MRPAAQRNVPGARVRPQRAQRRHALWYRPTSVSTDSSAYAGRPHAQHSVRPGRGTLTPLVLLLLLLLLPVRAAVWRCSRACSRSSVSSLILSAFPFSFSFFVL